MRVRVLGCSGGIGPGLRTTSLLIDDDILIDAGTGVGDLDLDEMARIRHVYLTHSHLDHIAALPLMVDSIFDRIQDPLVIHGQPATLEAIQKHIFNWSIWPDFSRLPDPEHPVICYEAMRPGEDSTLVERKIKMIAVNHIVPAVGYLVQSGSRYVAFSGDTTTNDSFWDTLNAHDDLHLLVVEAAFSNADEPLCHKARHYCPRLLAADLVKLRHRPEIYITHNKPGEEDTIYAECRSAITDRDIKRLAGNQVFQL